MPLISAANAANVSLKLSDLERRLDDMQRATNLTNGLMLIALGSLVGSSPIKTQRTIDSIERFRDTYRDFRDALKGR
jgi:hypothetical protein